ncbi:hypothetical protein MMC30_000464 [Trapelia coarctata]|nr:hypothetical protein [Trapelia coarctata]
MANSVDETYVMAMPFLLACGLVLCILAIRAYRGHKGRVDVPVVGWGGTLVPWPAAIWNIRYARQSVQKGYEKHKDYAFQIPTLSRWEVFICNETMIKEYKNLDSDLMSANAVTAELFQAKYALPGAQENIHKISIPTLSKGITWMRMRAAAKGDPYFAEFYAEFLYSFAEEASSFSVFCSEDVATFASWVDENAPSEYNDRDVALQLANIVFGAIHTTSQLLVHSLYEIATRPEYVAPLREEVNECLAKHGGWNKDALEAMHKLDSFVRESQRWNPLDAGSMARRAQEAFTFSNGLRIPAGTWIFAPNSPVLIDPKNYPSPEKFDGFRYSRLREEPGQSRNFTLVSSSSKNLQFGDGRHGCPGRHMAADEIRLMLAHILINYDVAIEGHGPRPPNLILGKFIFPNLGARIMLKRIHG